ncbi:MAG: glycoside hydrolase family 3 protein [Hyphomicrobiaceae bacterium]|nr:glycoside hydrolase family 3 protein [Hyphomicrobiaceae bacterium]MCC0024761.1 glycoside hydrolase family 3 protein [Hyphomicrobiaceae bacterium]
MLRAVVAAIVIWAGALSAAFAQDLEHMAGQMIVVGFQGDSLDDSGVKAMLNDVAAGRVGGVMFLGNNVASSSQVTAIVSAIRAAAPAGLPPLIALDQEGGKVERLTAKVGFKEEPTAAEVSAMGEARASAIYNEMANGLMEWGFNTNFGPVVDLNVNPNNPIIARFGRSFGDNGQEVAGMAGTFINAHHNYGILTALKHFPGHGSSQADSHEGFVDISKSWSAAELDPYQRLIGQGMADMIMAGHLFANEGAAGDSETYPASLSSYWITDVLRGQLGFGNGVVITDDMEMGAIRQNYGFKQAILQAVRAGDDILLFSNTAKPRTTLANEVQAILVDEAERDPAFRQRIEESYRRIVAMKERI